MYDKYKEYIKIIIFYGILAFFLLYKLPYVIYTGGKIENVNSKIEIENAYKSKGSFNVLAVISRNCNIPLYIYGLINKNTELVKIDELKINEKENIKDIEYRDKLDLKEANNNAIINAYNMADKEYEIRNIENIIYFLIEDSETNLKVKDKIISYDDILYDTLDNFKKYLETKNINDKIIFKIKRDNKEIECYAIIKEIENTKKIGVGIISIGDVITNDNIKIDFGKHESGPSGGLMVALQIYDYLTENDLTKGKKIAGTGTIDREGNIGPVGGIKYKLQGAVKNKADIMIVSNEDNYEECQKLIKKNKYKIKLIGVNTFKEAIEELNKIKE